MYRRARVAGLDYEAIGALHFHSVIEGAVDQINEVASGDRSIVAVCHDDQLAAGHTIVPGLLQLDVHLHRGAALDASSSMTQPRPALCLGCPHGHGPAWAALSRPGKAGLMV